jgi:hypothetical protein
MTQRPFTPAELQELRHLAAGAGNIVARQRH